MGIVFIGLGSNLGNKKENLDQALIYIQERIGNIISSSSVYETAPCGFSSENLFLNMAIKVNTSLSPDELLLVSKTIERLMGRSGKSSENSFYEDRVIDLDILFYDNIEMSTPELTIPHPLLHTRLFVLDPMSEIAPEWEHPVLHQTISTIKVNLRCSKK
ncbi:MAG: 2-amino-4-hydroxy-6-hydroxymethyldihydropteridine diphosphokinase [Bacteroidales bacterium]|nr:2-amino-4-hydroxy-6-hydroxymethyldihydropteridine diphosphokinase [Bacteroidales bacterium]MDD4821243.1 2-amino-4-hydroxy-6-hydroxymethyldihydropteridine diphosphokinase [Bacteroidales bacterium]